MTSEIDLARIADAYALDYLSSVEDQRVFPDGESLALLGAFDEPLPEGGIDGATILRQMHAIGSPNTVVSNGPNYYGFVIGAALPVAAAAERLMMAWDQCASSPDGSPIADKIEHTARAWLLDILDLPRKSAVGFGTSATACAISCLTAARRELLRREGWDFDGEGLAGAPAIRFVLPETAHITMKKAVRVLGIGMNHVEYAPCDDYGRVDPARLPTLDRTTILCLQAGEVNTGAFDRFAEIIPLAQKADAWVHVDGAFGLWARAGSDRAITQGADQADSWTTDGHKWLNTPYDGAVAICRHPQALAEAMNSDAAYSIAAWDAQKNLTLEFSRRARGIPIWAALKGLGREGVRDMVDRHCMLARRIAEGLDAAGYTILNRVWLNQVLIRADTDERTLAILAAAQATGKVWFGPAVWQGRPAFRISVSSWRTEPRHVEALIDLLSELGNKD